MVEEQPAVVGVGAVERAHGQRVLAQVSSRLTSDFGRGFSMANVEQMRKFYRVYSTDEIPQRLSEEFGTNLPTISTGRKFYLSWSHYIFLMRIDDVDERHFYEIESAVEGWSPIENKLRRTAAEGWYGLPGSLYRHPAEPGTVTAPRKPRIVHGGLY